MIFISVINMFYFFLKIIFNLLYSNLIYYINKKLNNQNIFFKKFYYINLKYFVNNIYVIFVTYILFEVPRKFSFFILYNFGKFIFSKNLKNWDNFSISFFFKNFFFRYLIVILTTIPYIVLNANNKLVLLIFDLYCFSYENFSSFMSTILLNIMDSLTYSIDQYIYKFNIYFYRNYLYFNPQDYSKNFNTLKNSIKDEYKMRTASNLLSKNSYLANVKSKESLYSNFKSNNLSQKPNYVSQYNEKLDNTSRFLNQRSKQQLEQVKQIQPGKSHLTVMCNTNSDQVIYTNETSKDSLYVYNLETDLLEKLNLNYHHIGSMNKKLDTCYTPNIVAKKEDLVITNADTLIKDRVTQSDAFYNARLAFLLNSDGTLLTHAKVKSSISDQFFTKLTKFDNKNTTLFDLVQKNPDFLNKEVNEAIHLTKEFIEINRDIILEIPEPMRLEFIAKCTNFPIETIKESIFYIFKKN